MVLRRKGDDAEGSGSHDLMVFLLDKKILIFSVWKMLSMHLGLSGWKLFAGEDQLVCEATIQGVGTLVLQSQFLSLAHFGVD